MTYDREGLRAPGPCTEMAVLALTSFELDIISSDAPVSLITINLFRALRLDAKRLLACPPWAINLDVSTISSSRAVVNVTACLLECVKACMNFLICL